MNEINTLLDVSFESNKLHIDSHSGISWEQDTLAKTI